MHKYLRVSFLALAPLLVAGCNSAPATEEPTLAAPRSVRPPQPAPEPPLPTALPAPLLQQRPTIPEPQIPKPNGYDLLARAALGIDSKSAALNDLPSQRAAVERHAASLVLMRQALQLPIVSPPARQLSSINRTRSKLRDLGRAVMQEAKVYAADSDFTAATQSGLDALQIGVAAQNGGSLDFLVGVAIEQIAQPDLWTWRAKLNANSAQHAAQRVAAIEAKRPSFAAIVSEEKWANLTGLRELLAAKEWKQFRAGDNKALSGLFKNPADLAQLKKIAEPQIEANLIGTMDASIARAKLPYSLNLPRIAAPNDALSALLTGSQTANYSGISRLVYERSVASSRLLQTAYAIQAFVKDNSKNPQTLNDLVPKYLQSVPRDPSASTAPLQFKISGDKWTLYSVGPDGIDDGATPIPGRGISRDSKGDVVGGAF